MQNKSGNRIDLKIAEDGGPILLGLGTLDLQTDERILPGSRMQYLRKVFRI